MAYIGDDTNAHVIDHPRSRLALHGTNLIAGEKSNVYYNSANDKAASDSNKERKDFRLPLLNIEDQSSKAEIGCALKEGIDVKTNQAKDNNDQADRHGPPGELGERTAT